MQNTGHNQGKPVLWLEQPIYFYSYIYVSDSKGGSYVEDHYQEVHYSHWDEFEEIVQDPSIAMSPAYCIPECMCIVQCHAIFTLPHSSPSW